MCARWRNEDVTIIMLGSFIERYSGLRNTQELSYFKEGAKKEKK
jgi:hypothetical protein